ncbi:S4 domain-containing protein YaaA [Microaerobacter geothermalis]|uniref:S4 domain-containing protein YaaA n=1 Tax=Microaerobacter geothermalis TaxID=674972 RepID=UPI001F189C1E|nr:S4 domain-containing protein YaaA [Microaerobacter geothermalis]MCF6095092.1 S4 domain-containing protein YaaA [Microaerobacter geothermalis]
MNKEIVEIQTEYITLGQILKLSGIVDTGGQIKTFLTNEEIFVNGIMEKRRGKKLYPGDIITFWDNEIHVKRRA